MSATAPSALLNTDLSERRRRQITDAARRVIARSGVERTRIVDVANEAGVSAGMIQHYFRTRDAMIAATFQRFFDESRDEWTAAIEAQPDPLRKLRALLGILMETRTPAVELFSMWIELHAVGTRNPQLGALAAAGWDDWLADFEQIIAAGEASGTFTPGSSARDVGIRLVSLLDGLSIHVVTGHYGMTKADMYRHAVAAAAQELSVPIDDLLQPELLAPDRRP